MFLFIFLLLYFVTQPILSIGTFLLFVFGVALSIRNLTRENKQKMIHINRIIFCLILPILNFLMYFSTISGNAGTGFEFSPISLRYYIIFFFQLIFIILPECFTKFTNRLFVFLYPIGLLIIVFLTIFFLW